MRTLTCLHHPNLRWYTKPEACNPDGSYNGARNIFFVGQPVEGPLKHAQYDPKTNTLATECACSPSDLRFAPDDQGA